MRDCTREVIISPVGSCDSLTCREIDSRLWTAQLDEPSVNPFEPATPTELTEWFVARSLGNRVQLCTTCHRGLQVAASRRSNFRTQALGVWRDRADAVCNWLGRIGYPTNPASRIEAYRSAIRDATSQESAIASDLLIRSIREISELFVIRDRFRCCPITANAKPLFSKLIRGGLHPDEEGQNTAARDSQFHLYLAAVLRFSRVSPVFDEPDLVIPKRSLGIAVKRLTGTSSTNFKRRIRKGSAQLAQAGLRGLICLNLSEVMAPQREMMHFDSTEAIARFYEESENWFDTFQSRHGSEIGTLIEPTFVIAVLIFWNVVCFLTDSGTAVQHTFVGTIPMHETNSDARLSALFLDRAFRRGLQRADQL